MYLGIGNSFTFENAALGSHYDDCHQKLLPMHISSICVYLAMLYVLSRIKVARSKDVQKRIHLHKSFRKYIIYRHKTICENDNACCI